MKHVVCVVGIMALMLGAVGWARPADATHLPTLVAENGVSPVIDGATDGDWVVWSSTPYDVPDAELLAKWRSMGETFAVTGPSALRGYDLERAVVVWSAPEDGCETLPAEPCDFNIYARSLPGDHVYDVATTDDIEESPVISETLVVWNAWDGDKWHIRARDIGDDASEPVTLYSEDPNQTPEDYARPVVARPYVAWATYWESDNPDRSFGWSLWVQNLDTDGPPQVVAEGLGLLTDIDLAGWTLVYTSEGTGTIALDLTTQEMTTVDAPALEVTTDGRYVIWTAGTGTGGDAGNGTALWGFDLATGARFGVAFGNRFVLAPDLSNGWLAWERGGLPFPDDEYPHDIHVAPMTDLLPSGWRPAPEATIPEIVYYPESGHYLGWQFRMYWEANGGLPVFGYPLTEEYEERNTDTGNIYPVQFFERQRFELHAENTGTPYEILLGRLGYEDALHQGLLDSAGFQPVLHDYTRSDDCTWFGETSQMVCTEFMDYWRSHGLDFGDDGTSYRESLALFGYPISRPYVDPDTGLLTQYFERAVFELHPDNPEPYRVLLRRLGAEELKGRAW